MAGTVNYPVGDFAIERVALGIELVEPRERIFHLKQRTPSVVSRPLVKQGRRHIEIDDPTGGVQATSIFGIQYDSTARCKHDSALLCQRLNGQRLPAPKTCLPFDLEYRRNVDAGSGLDFMVRIHKAPAEALCQLAPDSGLAGPHKSDEVDVVVVIHPANSIRRVRGNEKGPALPAPRTRSTASIQIQILADDTWGDED